MTTTTTTTTPEHLLKVSDLNRQQLHHLLDLAAEMKAEPLGWRGAQAGKVLACFFSKPSTRTRVSLEAAAQRLGMLPLMLRPDELQLGRGEPIADTGRVLSSYVDAITIRTFAQSDVEQLAAAATVPVINALTDEHHPCQALADLLTIREHFGQLEGVRVAYLGDGNNVAHSLMEAGALAGMESSSQPPTAIARTRRSRSPPTRRSSPIRSRRSAAPRSSTPTSGSRWARTTEREQRLSALADYQVSSAIMDAASHDALFMHCLPAHRGEEVTAEVIDGPRSVVFQQAANRLPTEQALIHTLIERWQ